MLSLIEIRIFSVSSVILHKMMNLWRSIIRLCYSDAFTISSHSSRPKQLASFWEKYMLPITYHDGSSVQQGTHQCLITRGTQNDVCLSNTLLCLVSQINKFSLPASTAKVSSFFTYRTISKRLLIRLYFSSWSLSTKPQLQVRSSPVMCY